MRILDQCALVILIKLVNSLKLSEDLPPRHAWTNEIQPTCRRTDRVCKVNLVLSDVLSMTWLPEYGATKRAPVFYEDGVAYYKSDAIGCIEKKRIYDEDILRYVPTIDGNYDYIFAINNSMPGPTITVFKGQEVQITFHNKMSGNAVTMHFHGQHQYGTPWMDGAGGISQCALEPGESFTHRFSVQQTGTYFYHSHKGAVRSYGLAGAFIVLPEDWKLTDEKRQNDESSPQDSSYNKEFVMTVADWHNISSPHYSYLHGEGLNAYSGFYARTDGCGDREMVDGSGTERYAPRSVLINGRGWEYLPSNGMLNVEPKNSALPLERFSVVSGGRYRFRVINTGMVQNIRVSIDEHPLTIIATDGVDIQPITAESVFVTPGERFDFEITADDPLDVGSYWIRAETAEAYLANGKPMRATHSEAILHYTHTEFTLPTTRRERCTESDECVVISCPFRFYPASDHIRCVHYDGLYSLYDHYLSPYDGEGFIEHFINMNTAASNVNGRNFVYPKAPPQIYPPFDFVEEPCNPTECLMAGPRDLCRCTYIIKIPLNYVVQLTISSLNLVNHPVHIHGTNFQVLKQGWGEYNSTTAEVIGHSGDILCSDDSCPKMRWTNPAWKNGNIPDVEKARPIVKDNVMVPKGSYVVTRFLASNPGYWLLHCHYESHNHAGMALILQVGEPQEMPPLPAYGFKTCGVPQDRPIDWNTGVDVTEFYLKETNRKFIEAVVIASVITVSLITVIIFINCYKPKQSNVNGVINKYNSIEGN